MSVHAEYIALGGIVPLEGKEGQSKIGGEWLGIGKACCSEQKAECEKGP
jgi:hypothetical protein